MIHVSFELTMPNVGSWNGQWTGASRKYFVTRSYGQKGESAKRVMELLADKKSRSFYYNFGDGWGANVNMELTDAKENKKRQKISAGFSGYEWMIDSILKIGKITTNSQLLATHQA